MKHLKALLLIVGLQMSLSVCSGSVYLVTGKQTREVAGVGGKPSSTTIHNAGRGLTEEDEDDESDDYEEEDGHKETIAQVSHKTSCYLRTWFHTNQIDLVPTILADLGRCS